MFTLDFVCSAPTFLPRSGKRGGQKRVEARSLHGASTFEALLLLETLTFLVTQSVERDRGRRPLAAAEPRSPNANVGRSRGEGFRPQVSITPTSTLEPTICVPDGMLVLWPSGAGDWDGDWEQREFRIAPVSARLFPCSFSAIFLAVFAICAAANGARLPAQTQIPPHLSPFASTMTQQLLQGFSASPCLPLPPSLPHLLLPPLTSLLHHAHQTKQIFFFFPQPDSETQQNIEASERDSEFILAENLLCKMSLGNKEKVTELRDEGFKDTEL